MSRVLLCLVSDLVTSVIVPCVCVISYCTLCVTVPRVLLLFLSDHVTCQTVLASDCHVSYCALCLRTCFTVPSVSNCVTFLNVLWVCVTRLVVCLVIMSHAFLCSAPNSDLCLTVSHVLLNLVTDCVTCFSMLCGYATCLIVLCG